MSDSVLCLIRLVLITKKVQILHKLGKSSRPPCLTTTMRDMILLLKPVNLIVFFFKPYTLMKNISFPHIVGFLFHIVSPFHIVSTINSGSNLRCKHPSFRKESYLSSLRIVK